jgi:hypothetical protein
MNDTRGGCRRTQIAAAFGAALLGLSGAAALAQSTTLPATSGTTDRSPLYIGVSQGFTHDSNVSRVPNGPADNQSSTSLLGGFDQDIGRQRVFGTAIVSVNRYQDQTQLDNTSYSLAAGLDWATINRLSGNLNASLNQSLVAPAANGVVPDTGRTIARAQFVSGGVRWGEPGRLTVEARLGHQKTSYSAAEYASAGFEGETGSLGAYYRPGGALRVGVALRADSTRTADALRDPVSGDFQSNDARSRNVDLLADYELADRLVANGRLSLTRLSNSDAGFSLADYSGLTGSLHVDYRATAKISVLFYASRDANLSAASGSGSPGSPGGSSSAGTPVVTPVTTSTTGLYESNQVSDAVGLGLAYRATAKISANAGVRYARARLVAIVLDQAAPLGTDVQKRAYLGATYALARSVGVGCLFGRETRRVSGSVPYTYVDTSIGCSAQLTWK